MAAKTKPAKPAAGARKAAPPAKKPSPATRAEAERKADAIRQSQAAVAAAHERAQNAVIAAVAGMRNRSEP